MRNAAKPISNITIWIENDILCCISGINVYDCAIAFLKMAIIQLLYYCGFDFGEFHFNFTNWSLILAEEEAPNKEEAPKLMIKIHLIPIKSGFYVESDAFI